MSNALSLRNFFRPKAAAAGGLLAFSLMLGMAGDAAAQSYDPYVPANDTGRPSAASYTQMMDMAESGRIGSASVQQRTVVYSDKNGKSYTTRIPDDVTNASDRLAENGVQVTAYESRQPSGLSISTILSLAMLGIMVYFLLNMMRAQKGGGAMGFGKSKAKLTEVGGRVTFDDVAGVDDAKEELTEMVDYLRDPHRFAHLGAKLPKGALLSGPPGTGKTLLARAVAGEAGVPFFTISGSDFVEMFVGVGASRVRDMFADAKKRAPCIIFIDEIDAVGGKRGSDAGGGGNSEREQTLNQLLVEMDGFEGNEGIIILAATNRPDTLDPALLRPGRFDRQVQVNPPDVIGREKVLRLYMRKVPCAPNVDAKVVARGTPGFAGADLANLVNEAALMAARRNARLITMDDFEKAKDKILMGPERKTLMMTAEEKRLTAYHEAGHALVSILKPGNDPIHKGTIMPRGRALGMVVSLPEGDSVSYSMKKAKAVMAMTAAGKAAEEHIFGKENVTSGPSGDIQQMTRLANAMVREWGMAEEVGMVRHAPGPGESPFTQDRSSEQTKATVDRAIKGLIDEGFAESVKLISEHEDKLHMLAQGLLEFETLHGREMRAIVLEGKMPVRDENPAPLSEDERRAILAIPRVGKKRVPEAPQGPQGPVAP